MEKAIGSRGAAERRVRRTQFDRTVADTFVLTDAQIDAVAAAEAKYRLKSRKLGQELDSASGKLRAQMVKILLALPVGNTMVHARMDSGSSVRQTTQRTTLTALQWSARRSHRARSHR